MDGSTYTRKNQKVSADIQQEVYFAPEIVDEIGEQVTRNSSIPLLYLRFHFQFFWWTISVIAWNSQSRKFKSHLSLYFHVGVSTTWGTIERWERILEEAGLKEDNGSCISRDL